MQKIIIFITFILVLGACSEPETQSNLFASIQETAVFPTTIPITTVPEHAVELETATSLPPAAAAPAPTILPTAVPETVASAPRGIYLLGNPNSLSLLAKADQPYIDGYALRTSWTTLDTGTNGPTYDFSFIEDAVAALQTLSNNQNNRMKLTLAIFVRSVPGYVLQEAETYQSRPTPNKPEEITAVPWDPVAQSAYRHFFQALADHQVYDAVSDQMIPLRDHPAIGQINAGIIGLQGIRDVEGRISAIPSYTREKFTDALLSSLHAVQDAFPQKFVYVSYFSMQDGSRTPSLDEVLLDAIAAEFDGVKNPAIGLFQENLRGDSLQAASRMGQNLQAAYNNGNYIMFQACGIWTGQGICEFNPEDSSPANGFANGHANFGALYYELYPADLENPEFQAALFEWHDILWQAPYPTTLPDISSAAGQEQLSSLLSHRQ